MNSTTVQCIAQGIIVIGSIFVIGGTFVSFIAGKKIEQNKDKEIVQKELTIMALSNDPVLKLNLVENDKFNLFSFTFQNTGTSDINIKEICEDYFFNTTYAYGTSGSSNIYKLDQEIDKRSIHNVSINLMDSLYNIEQFKNSLNKEIPQTLILRIKIKYSRIIDQKQFEFNQYYILMKNIAEEGKYELIDPEKFRDPNIDIHKYIKEIET